MEAGWEPPHPFLYKPHPTQARAAVSESGPKGTTGGQHSEIASSFKRILGVLTTGTCPELSQQIQYLKLESQILRSKIRGPVRATKQEKAQLIHLGKPLGKL